MKVQEGTIPGLIIIDPTVHGDERGFFMETYSRQRYEAAGVSSPFVQDNLSSSRKGILRGLHLQHPSGQGKLCSVLDGEVFDVAVDVRVGSPHFGRWHGVTLSSSNKRQFYIPPGFAHGFCVVSDRALFSYKCTEQYAPEHELGVAWDDDEVAIDWPIDNPILSDKDRANPKLRDIVADKLPRYA
ncbi:MAG: dTDP-4-dehydrorhamnose 3,5-epimerase [Myxococcota bacterium]